MTKSLCPFRCISCGAVYCDAPEWCPDPCNTDLRDTNNRVATDVQKAFAVLSDFAFNSPQGRSPERFQRRAREALDG